MTMTTGYQYEMKCGHAQYSLTFPRCNMRCERCNHIYPVAAVETREWHVKCNNCRYGRWCGASESNGLLLARAHCSRYGHTARVEYIRNAASYERLRSIMKRSVRWYVDVKPHTLPGARRYSESSALPLFPSPDYETPPY